MTSRERVKRCVEFGRPDRVPWDMWLLPATRLTHGDHVVNDILKRWPLDFTQCSKGRPPPRKTRGDATKVGESVDEWGCVFVNIKEGASGEVKDPIVKDWSDLRKLEPPNEFLQVDRDVVNAWCRSTDKFVFASGWARTFERMQFIRGTENLYYDLGEESDGFHELLGIVHGFFRKQYQQWARTDVDSLAIMDDWGMQNSLLISPAQWRRIFKPLYAEYCAIAHENGKKVFMHSDGNIMDIYEDLIEIGVDAINSQLFCMDIEEIGRRFGGRITFWGEIDRQHVLPFGTVAETRDAVARVVKNLWRPEGGVIAQCSFQGDSRPENVDAVYRAWMEMTGGTEG